METDAYQQEKQAIQEAYKDTFVTYHGDIDVGRVKDKAYAEDLAREEDKWRSADLNSEKLAAAVEADTERKILADMQRYADFIILRNAGGKYTAAKKELLARFSYKKDYIEEIMGDTTDKEFNQYSTLRNKRQSEVNFDDGRFGFRTRKELDKIKKYQENQRQKREPDPDILREEIQKKEEEMRALKARLEAMGNTTH